MFSWFQRLFSSSTPTPPPAARPHTPVPTIGAIGRPATVTAAIPVGGTGEIETIVDGRVVRFHARSKGFKDPFPRNSVVRVIAATDLLVYVEKS